MSQNRDGSQAAQEQFTERTGMATGSAETGHELNRGGSTLALTLPVQVCSVCGTHRDFPRSPIAAD